MIVFCEECGERNIIELDEARDAGNPPRCRACNDILKFSLTQVNAAQNEADALTDVPAPLTPTQLELRLGNSVISISQTRPSVTMGRQEHNDLEVIDTRVSRSHARIEYRKGQFILIDHSTNGTFVQFSGKQGINLKRGEIPLEGSGIITLGRKVTPDSPKAIHFSLKQ